MRCAAGPGFWRGGGKSSWRRFAASMRPAGHRQQMLDRARVVPEDASFADAEPAAFGDDDAAGLERLGRFFDHLPAGGDSEIRVPRGELADQAIDPALEIAARDRGA